MSSAHNWVRLKESIKCEKSQTSELDGEHMWMLKWPHIKGLFHVVTIKNKKSENSLIQTSEEGKYMIGL